MWRTRKGKGMKVRSRVEDVPTAMTPEEIAESCERTADLLEGHWTTEAWYRTENERIVSYCIEGGLAAALGVSAFSVAQDPDVRKALMDCPVYMAVQETLVLQVKAHKVTWKMNVTAAIDKMGFKWMSATTGYIPPVEAEKELVTK
jgi:hypothetical protein